MTILDFFEQLQTGIQQTTWYELVAVCSGIISVYYSKKESIWVYPIGLINTLLYVFISLKGHLLGEAAVNVYYTIMSVVGWRLWALKNGQHQTVYSISRSTRKEWIQQLSFFAGVYVIVFSALLFFKQHFFPGAIPWADAFASATAFTAMWLMTRKKIESWYWWLATNIASIPLYFVKQYVFTSCYYFVLLVLAVLGWMEWRKKLIKKI
jgi:nicotinamide mononucleotide transporter